MTNTPPTTPPPSKTTGGPRNIPPPPQVSASREAIFDSRFRVIDRLASSGSATVYLCEDLTLRSRAAVKVLNTADAEMRQRFLEEATLLANVRHPHLVQVLSAGELADGSPYIAMDDLGENLDRRLRDGEPLSWREVVQVALQVAAALQVLHKAGVIHRDVKPSNIAQVQGENGQVFVKLIDLGIARAEDLASVQQGGDELPTREGTLEGVALGTPGFMPPEAGLCVPTPGFDVYALGASIFLLCTGELHNPIEPRTMQEVRPEIEIPVELEAVVMRALAVIPEERIASAAAFSRQLAAVQTTEGSGSPQNPPVLFDGRFELIQLLGIGAKAEVYRAYDCGARRNVALKILREEAIDNAEDRARFDREARVLGVLDHPAIPALIECRLGQEQGYDGPVFIAMECRKGQPVSALGVELLSPEKVLEVGLELSSALAAMHACGVIHRDLHRSNVLLERRNPSIEDPRTLRVSLVDFGQVELENRFYAETEERYLTPPGDRKSLGTGGLENLDWSAPETRQGGPWTPKSDVYSLGLMLYRLLTGKRPPKDPKENWSPQVEHVPEDWGALVDAILGALLVDPKMRFDALTLGSYLREAGDEVREIKLEEAASSRRDESESTAVQALADENCEQKPSASNPGNIDAAYLLEPVHDALDDARRELVHVGEEIDGAAVAPLASASRTTATPASARAAPKRRRLSPWMVIGALVCISFGVAWLLRRTPRTSIANPGALARGQQPHEQRPNEKEDAGIPRSESDQESAREQHVADKGEEGNAPEAASEQDNAGVPHAAKTENAGGHRAAKRKKRKKRKNKSDLLPTRGKSSAKQRLSPRKAREIALSVARGDLELCLPRTRGWAHMEIAVAADGSLEKVSLDGPSGPVKACLRRRLEKIRFRSGAYSTTHRLQIGAKSR